MKDRLEIKNLSKHFGDKRVLDNLSFHVNSGEFLSILGPSGCGKTTLLRILIGVETCDSGLILKDGQDIAPLTPIERGMGIVFQNYALFPNMTVLGNVMYALKNNKKTRPKARERALDIIERVGLTEHINKRPHKLSGGQQQRVAIARTLAVNPDIVLFDEPMSALDAANRIALRKEFKQIQKEFSITMIYITHDQEEAFAMSDRIMVMSEGHIEQIDTPRNLYQHPCNEYVEEFVGWQLKEKIKSIADTTGMFE